MLQEEGLNCRQYTTGSAFFLEDRIMHFLIKEEALGPGCVEASLLTFKE